MSGSHSGYAISVGFEIYQTKPFRSVAFLYRKHEENICLAVEFTLFFFTDTAEEYGILFQPGALYLIL
jgi:hypothetical protein